MHVAMGDRQNILQYIGAFRSMKHLVVVLFTGDNPCRLHKTKLVQTVKLRQAL